MHKRIKFYIGANNQTGKVELEKALSIIDRHFEGYTVYNTGGIWKGKGEDSVVVEVLFDTECKSYKAPTMQTADELKTELQQQCVIVTIDTVEEVLYV